MCSLFSTWEICRTKWKKAPSLLSGVWLPVLHHWYSYWLHCLGDVDQSWRQLFNKNLEKASEESLSLCFTQPCLCALSGMWDSCTADESILAIYSVNPNSQACFPLPWTSLTIIYSPGNLDYWLDLVGAPNALCSPCSHTVRLSPFNEGTSHVCLVATTEYSSTLSFSLTCLHLVPDSWTNTYCKIKEMWWKP